MADDRPPQYGQYPPGYPPAQGYPPGYPQGYPQVPPQGYPYPQGYPPQGAPYPPQGGYPPQYPPQQPFNPQGGYGAQFDQGPPPPYNGGQQQPPKPSYQGGPSNPNPGGQSPAPAQVKNYQGKYQDLWAAILFVIHVIGIAAVAIFLGKKGLDNADKNRAPRAAPTARPRFAPAPSPGKEYEIGDYAPQLAAAVAIGAVFSIVWLQILRLAPKAMIYVSLWGGVIMMATLGVIYLAMGKGFLFIGVIFLFVAAIQALYAYLVRNRIPFTASMLKRVVGVLYLYPATVVVSYFSVVLTVGWMVIWVFGAAGATTVTNAGPIVFGLLVSLYWTLQVIRNTVHVTVSGVMATHYFQQNSMPPNPTRRALGRALTTSFGSICLGSLLVAIIQATREVIRQARQNGDGNEFVLSCLDCLLGLLEGLVRLFNKYAYVQVAIYGKSFTQAARDTWELFKAQGIELLINDDLTGGVLVFGMLIGGVICGVICGIWTLVVHDSQLAVGVALVSFLIGFGMTSLPLVVIESGVASFYVCYAEDPAVLARNDPAFYQKINEKHQMMMRG